MKIAILGYGQMGKTIERLAIAAGHEIVLKIGRSNAAELTIASLQKADVAIEFSVPDTAFHHISTAIEAGIPVVAGTTAWLDKLEEIHALCKAHKGAFLYASNFSIGVNLFFALNRYLAKHMAVFPEYKVEMKEIHHTKKLDAPSGTAISLAEDIIHSRSDLKGWINQASSAHHQLPIVSKREGVVPGTHEINYRSAIDTITIRHEAHSRKGFALGALKAAEWIVGKEGVFEMKDVLEI